MSTRSAKGGISPIILILMGVGLLLFTGTRAAAQSVAQRFGVTKVGVRIDKWLLNGILLRLTMHIRNDSSVAIPIDGFQGVIQYGPTVLAPIQLDNPISIAPNQETIVPFTAPIDYADFAQNIAQIIQSKNFLNNLRVSGQLMSKGITVPVSKNLLALG